MSGLPVPITAVFAALLALMLVGISVRVAHAWALYASFLPARAFGTTANWILLAAGALLVLGLVH